MLKDIIDFINNFWKSKYVYLYIIVLFIIMNLNNLKDYFLYSKKSWLSVISILVICIIILLIIRDKRKFPKFKKDKLGIVFAIDIENEEQYNLINNKFVKEFQRELIKEDKHYEVVMLNSFASKKFIEKYPSKELREDFLNKYRIKFIIFGTAVFGSEKDKIACKLHLNSGISHKPMPNNNHKILITEMSNIFKPLKNIEILKESEIDGFETNASQLNYAYNYIMASTCLLSSDVEDAYKLFTNLKKELTEFKKNIPVVNYIKSIINDRIIFCGLLLSQNELYLFYENKNHIHLATMKKYLDIIESISKTSYQYKLLISIYYFLADRNVETSLRHIEDCKEVKSDDGWKFSKVFLKLYHKDSATNFMNAYKVYNQNFIRSKVTFNYIINISDFIIRVLEEEPSKRQLYFLLFLISYYLGDTILADKYYNEFIISYSFLITNENFRKILIKLEKLPEELVRKNENKEIVIAS